MLKSFRVHCRFANGRRHHGEELPPVLQALRRRRRFKLSLKNAATNVGADDRETMGLPPRLAWRLSKPAGPSWANACARGDRARPDRSAGRRRAQEAGPAHKKAAAEVRAPLVWARRGEPLQRPQGEARGYSAAAISSSTVPVQGAERGLNSLKSQGSQYHLAAQISECMGFPQRGQG